LIPGLILKGTASSAVPFLLAPRGSTSAAVGQGARGNLSRRWAQLKTEDGSFTKLSRRAAFEMVSTGDFEILRSRPLTISLIRYREFQEEQRHLSGRRIPGVSKPPFNGKSSTSSGIRVRPDRAIVNPDFVRTAILSRDNLQGWIERWDEEAKKAGRKKRRGRRRKKR